MKTDYARLITAASELKGWCTPSEIAAGLVAKGLSVSPQTLTNWKTRGIAKHNYGTISRIVGCRPLWLEFGEGAMTDATTGTASRHEINQSAQPEYTVPKKITRLPPPDMSTPLLRELMAIAETMSEAGQQRLIGQALMLAPQYPKAKANPAS